MISFIWEAFWLIGPPIGIGYADKKWYLVGGLCALMLCAYQSFSALIRDNNGLRQKLQKIEDSKPQIKLKSPAVHVIAVGHQFLNLQIGQPGFTENVPFLRIAFHNNPPTSLPNSSAKGVRAYVDFTPNGGNVPSLTMDGRWAESHQPPHYGPFDSKSELLPISFGFGESHNLDIAYISSVDHRCYAWNNDNYQHYNNSYVTPQHFCLRIVIKYGFA